MHGAGLYQSQCMDNTKLSFLLAIMGHVDSSSFVCFESSEAVIRVCFVSWLIRCLVVPNARCNAIYIIVTAGSRCARLLYSAQ
eukprot:scaffold315682_cov21-Prasinocladus_malaysianus.AAC.1